MWFPSCKLFPGPCLTQQRASACSAGQWAPLSTPDSSICILHLLDMGHSCSLHGPSGLAYKVHHSPVHAAPDLAQSTLPAHTPGTRPDAGALTAPEHSRTLTSACVAGVHLCSRAQECRSLVSAHQCIPQALSGYSTDNLLTERMSKCFAKSPQRTLRC